MKRTLIAPVIEDFPKTFHGLLIGADVYDSSCSPEARVCFIDKDGGYYLKRSAKGTLKTEAEMTSFFHSKGMGAEVISYISEGADWLLTSAIKGEDCTFKAYLDDPKRLCDLLAIKLRELHETDFSHCPVKDRMSAYVSTAIANFKAGQYDASYYLSNGSIAPAIGDIYKFAMDNAHLFKSDVLLHGDYCLPNTMLDNWRFSGFIDVGNGGVGDRHVDLYWGAWTLNFNLKTDTYRERFFDAYGRDKVDTEMIRLVSAFEVFG